MPNYKGHLVGGFVAFLIVINVIIIQKVSCLIALEWLGFTLLGSLFPDIDTKSKGQKIFYTMLLVLMIILLYKKYFFAITLCALIAFLPLLVNHRGIFHRLWFVTLLPLLLIGVVNVYFPRYATLALWDGFFFIVGAVSHLYLDLGFKRMMRIR